MAKCEHEWVADETTARDKWTHCKHCARQRTWHQIASEARDRVRALEDRLATAVAAHIETKRDVSNAWTEHLSTCWEADTVLAAQERDQAIRERDDARRQALDDALAIVASDKTHADVHLAIAALLAEEHEPKKEPALIAADKQGYARGIEHAIAVCRHIAADATLHMGASACEAALQGKSSPHCCPECKGTHFVPCPDCSPGGCVTCAGTGRVRCNACRHAKPHTPKGVYVDFGLDGSPVAISETKPEPPAPTLRFFVSADDYDRVTRFIARADFAILGYKNQERADQYRIATLELMLDESKARERALQEQLKARTDART